MGQLKVARGSMSMMTDDVCSSIVASFSTSYSSTILYTIDDYRLCIVVLVIVIGVIINSKLLLQHY